MDINKIEAVYKKVYKPLMLIPLIAILIAVGILAYSYEKTGDIIDRDVSLKGGLTITINTQVSNLDFEDILNKNFKGKDFVVRKLAEFGSIIPVLCTSIDLWQVAQLGLFNPPWKLSP